MALSLALIVRPRLGPIHWEEILPQAEFETSPKHGRLVAYASPELIVRRLKA